MTFERIPDPLRSLKQSIEPRKINDTLDFKVSHFLLINLTGVLNKRVNSIEKPFGPAGLTWKVRELFDAV